MGGRGFATIAVLYSVPFIGSAVILIGAVLYTAITKEPVFVITDGH